MKSFESKAKDFYGEVVINKGLMSKAGFGARAVPVYVGEWIISQFIKEGDITDDGRQEIVDIVSKYLPQKADKNTILNRLREQEEVKILDDYRVNVNIEYNTHELSIPILDRNKEMVQKSIVDDNPMLLKTGMWGVGTMRYVPPDGEDVKKGQIWLVDFKPFQTPGVDLDYFRGCRKHFTLEEWIDLLVSSCQVNPSFINRSQKLILLSRIIPLVQPRVNIAELAPKGTGKSFVFDNISRYAAVIPGGKLTAPSLFFNRSSKQIGLIPRYDVVVVDEVQKIHTDAAGEAMAGLKMYMESGRYRRITGDMGTSECGFVMLGNITLDSKRKPLYESNGIFRELPPELQESAFVDRLQGLIEGWFMPRISRETPSKSLGFKGDFFSEVLHELRSDLQYADYVSQSMRLPDCDDMRDNKAIARIAEGYLKLLYPDLQLSEEDFILNCVNPAVRMRQQIRDELSKLDQEYKWTTIKSEIPDKSQKNHPPTMPELVPISNNYTPKDDKSTDDVNSSVPIEIDRKEEEIEEIRNIIAEGEGKNIEFKASIRWDYKQDKVNKDLGYDVSKTIAAFANTEGGTLLIGVDDNGGVLGLSNDYKTLGRKKNIDGFLLYLDDVISQYLGRLMSAYYKANVVMIDEKEICRVDVIESPRPVYVNENDFFIRSSASSRKLTTKEVNEYIKQHY